MSDVKRIPVNVTVDQTGDKHLIEWECCAVEVESEDQAQIVIDLLVNADLQAEQVEALTEQLAENDWESLTTSQVIGRLLETFTEAKLRLICESSLAELPQEPTT